MTKLYTRAGVSALVVVLSGCSVTPMTIKKSDALSAGLQDRLIVNRAQDEVIQKAISLNEAIARSLKYNRERRVQLMESVLSGSQLDVAKFDMLPELAASAGYTKRDSLGASASATVTNDVAGAAGTTYTVSSEKEGSTSNVALTWDLLDFGLSYVRAGQAADRVLISKERERKAVHNLIQDVRSAYWKALSAQRLLGRIGPLFSRVDAALKNAKVIQEQRLQDPIEVLSYQRDLLDIRRSLEGLYQDLVASKMALATLMGMPAGTALRLEDVDSYRVPDIRIDVETLEKTALASRPELMEARYESRISVEEGRAALLGLMPSLSLVAGRYYDDNMYLRNGQWESLGASLSFNLFNLFKINTVKQLAENQQALTEERRLAMTATVLGQVHISNVNYQQAKKRFVTATEYYNVVKSIRLQMLSLKDADKGGDLALIREEFSELLAELRRDVAYADVQNSYGRIFATAGFDPLPKQVSDDSLETLVSGIEKRFDAFEKGEVDLVSNPLSSQLSTPWSGPGAHEFSFAEDTFSLGGQMNYEAKLVSGEALPAWLTFNSDTRTFSGNPQAGIESLDIQVIANNQFGISAVDKFSLQLLNVNEKPAALVPGPIDVTLSPDNDFKESLGNGLFSDPDADELSLNLIVRRGFSGRTKIPLWIKYDPEQKVLSADKEMIGEVESVVMPFELTATDPAGSSVGVPVIVRLENPIALTHTDTDTHDVLEANKEEVPSDASAVVVN